MVRFDGPTIEKVGFKAKVNKLEATSSKEAIANSLEAIAIIV